MSKEVCVTVLRSARRYQLERHIVIVELVAFVCVTAWRCRHEEIAMRGQGNPSVCR